MNNNAEDFSTTPPDGQQAGYLPVLQAQQAGIYQKASKEITFSEPMLWYKEGVPVAYRNTIAVVSGKTGKFKSRLQQLICSVFLKIFDSPIMGMNALLGRYVVIYFDTERNLREQFPFAVQEIRRNAGYDPYKPINNFEAVSLLDIPRSERFTALSQFIEYARAKYAGMHLIIVIDVLTDICENFNDPRDTMPLIDLMNVNINRYDTTFFCVIHQNPSRMDDKARGHLGTELENKASTVITLENDTNSDLIKINCKKQRTAKPFSTIYARFDEVAGCLTLASDDEIQTAKQNAANVIDWNAIFSNEKVLDAGELKKRVALELGISERTAQRYVSDSVHRGDLLKTGNSNSTRYTLNAQIPVSMQDSGFSDDDESVV